MAQAAILIVVIVYDGIKVVVLPIIVLYRQDQPACDDE